jgi:DHA3 family macrolide efflux protein-like MFS transporter
LPVINASSQAIWQTKTSPEIQGRVFAIRHVIAWSSIPLAYLTAGPLADRLLEPLLAVDGPLAETIGRVTGPGPGRGIGLLFVLLGVVNLLAAAGGALYPRLRLVERELPDVTTETADQETTA